MKSASSSIEEIVARQFVERQARKRNITLPHGSMFADTPAAKKPAGKGGKAPEPPKPAPAVLRPRLVKAVKAADESPLNPRLRPSPRRLPCQNRPSSLPRRLPP